MTFTAEEKKYLVTNKGKWEIATDCPKRWRDILKRKLKLLYSAYE